MNQPAHPKMQINFPLIFWGVAIFCLFYFIGLIKTILLPFVVGILTAYFLDPLVKKLSSRHLSRSHAAAIISISFFTLFTLLLFLIFPMLSKQVTSLIHNAPGYLHYVQDRYLDSINDYIAGLTPEQNGAVKDAIGNLSGSLAGLAGGLANNVLQSGLAFLNLLSLIFITPIVAFYLLRDWNLITRRFDKLLPRKHEKTIMEQLKLIDITLSGFIRGQTNVCLIMAFYYSIALSFMGLNFALLVGILSGFVLFVPFVGFLFSLVIAATIALLQSGFHSLFFEVLAVYGAGMVMEGSFLTPRLIGSQTGLHPLWIIFGILAGGVIFGFVGVLIAVPITAVMGVLVKFALDKYMQSSLYLEPTPNVYTVDL